MRGLRRLAALSASAALLAMALGTPAPAAADPRPVTVRITIEKVNAIDCFEGETVAGCSGEADFYAVVSIDGVELAQSETIDDENNADPDPDWVFERVVDAGRGTVPVWVGVYDEDGGLRFDDDHADVSPVQGGDDKDLHLDVQVAPVCAATGDVTVPPEACGRTQTTDGDADEERARLFWTVEVIEPDTDGDWLPDSWEIGGLDADGDGVVEVDLPVMGADPLRKDLFLEIDCLVAAGSHSHCPIEDAVRTVVQALADAPVADPDGSFGIQLHVDIGDLYGHTLGLDTKVARAEGGAVGSYGNWGGGADRIPEAGNEIVDWDGMEGDPATSVYDLKALFFAPDRAYAFRYALSAHQVNARHPVDDCTGGWAEGGGVDAHGDPVAANDFIVSLGGLNDAGDPCWGTDAGGSSVGTWDQQAGVILHELGHTLGLGHGGGDAVNRKPNYLSVMNYAFGACSVPSIPGLLRGGCDFSRIALPTLEEVLPPGLDECAGIGLGLGPVDWDGADGLTGTTCSPASGNVSVNANGDFDDPNGNEIQDPGEEFIFGSLVGYEDWGRVAFGFRGTDYFANGSAPPPPDPMDPEAIATARAFLSDLAAPTLAVDATGPTDALPGDTLSYTVVLTNTGRGPALGTVLVDTLPDGTSGLFS
ncbi:MAG: DUF11 domain-containing protein, partial [Chloroflexi bacterium]|nr:DUF11 domain-containing protein [Chloroflexota bacterium]